MFLPFGERKSIPNIYTIFVLGADSGDYDDPSLLRTVSHKERNQGP